MVIFRTSEGKPGYHQAPSLDDAIRFVERLRNTELVENARIFQLNEVSFEFRPYFRVEVGAAGDAIMDSPEVVEALSNAQTPEPAQAPVVHQVVQPIVPTLTPVALAGGEVDPKRSIFGR